MIHYFTLFKEKRLLSVLFICIFAYIHLITKGAKVLGSPQLEQGHHKYYGKQHQDKRHREHEGQD